MPTRPAQPGGLAKRAIHRQMRRIDGVKPMAVAGRSSGIGGLARRPEAGSLLGLVVTYVFFAILGGQVFLGAPGWSSWLNMAAEVGIVALPVGLLMIAGELDISVGSVIPASSVTVA